MRSQKSEACPEHSRRVRSQKLKSIIKNHLSLRAGTADPPTMLKTGVPTWQSRFFSAFSLQPSAFKSEQGSILVMALVVLTALTILGMGVLTLSDTQTHLSSYEKNSAKTLNTAEKGLEKTMWYLNTYGNLSSVPGVTGTGSRSDPYWFHDVISTEESYYVKGVVPTSTRPYWEVRVKGTRGSAGNEQRIVAANVITLSLWDFSFSNNSMTGAGGKLRGEVSVHGPFYVKELLELSGNSAITGGPLMVKATGTGDETRGDLIMSSNSATVGTAASPILVGVEGSISGTGSDKVYADPLLDWVPDYEFPTLTDSDMADYKNNQAAFVYPRDFTGEASGDLTLLTTHIGPTGPGSPGIKFGTTPDGDSCSFEYSYNDVTKIGTLSLKNLTDPHKGIIIYISGKVNFGINSNKIDIVYDGRGTVVAEGVIGAPSTDTAIYVSKKLKAADITKFPVDQVLGIVTPQKILVATQHDPTATESDPDVEGAIYGKGAIEISSPLIYKGAIVSDQLGLSQNPQLYPDLQLSGNLPPGMPGAGDRITYFSRWREATTF